MLAAMSTSGDKPNPPVRRPPPPLVPVTVTRCDVRSPRLLRLGFAGDGLRSMEAPEPAGSVRLLVASATADRLVIPAWTGNEYLLPDGSRPALRTFTPLAFDRAAGTLDLEIVRHPEGAVSTWAESAEPGTEAAISGPARGLALEPSIERFVLVGDETALPAISQLLEAIPKTAKIEVHVEAVTAAAEIELPAHPGSHVTWHINDDVPGSCLVEVVTALGDLGERDHVWAAGEAASMQSIRKHLFNERGLARSAATVRGYWKPART